MGLSPGTKISVISSIIILTLSYAFYQKKKFGSRPSEEYSEVILKQMPSFEMTDFKSGEKITKESIAALNPQMVIIHFWGTWCAPCITEFPSLLEFAKGFSGRKGVYFYLVSIRDEKKMVDKFLKKYPNLSPNIIVGLNPSGEMLTQFGTVKVPETYVFDEKLFTKKKFIGPQEWGNPSMKLPFSNGLKVAN